MATPTPWPLWLTALLIVGAVFVSLLVAYLGYKLGLKAGKEQLEVYKNGQKTDGGCFVKHHVDLTRQD